VLNVADRPIHHEYAYRVGLFSGAAENYRCGAAMRLDPESHAWLEALRPDGPRRDRAPASAAIVLRRPSGYHGAIVVFWVLPDDREGLS
jgi:hypothetical protein